MQVVSYSGTLLRTIAWETASQIALRDCSEEEREEPGYTGVFAEKKHLIRYEESTANHKNQTSQVDACRAFLCTGRCRSLVSLKLFPDTHRHDLGPVPSFPPPWIPLRAHRGPQWLVALRQQRPLFTEMAGGVFLSADHRHAFPECSACLIRCDILTGRYTKVTRRAFA